MTVLRVELFGGNTYTKDLSRRIRQGKAKVFHQTLEATKRNHKEGVKAGVAVSSTSVPHWLKAVRGQTIETHPDRVASVQKIFRLATQGLGTKRIIKQLIADGDKPFGENGHWSKQYVLDTLRNRKVLGEWTPTLTNTETGEVETKETIYDYYPRIIDQTVFDKVQEMISARNRMDTESRKVSARTGGRIGAEVKNLFSHLIKCKGRAMSYHCKGDGKYQYLVTNYVKGEKADRLRYDRFENAFLYFLKHLDWKAIAGEGDTEELTAARLNLEEIATEIDRIRHQIAKWEEIVNNPEAPMDVVISMEKRINEKRPRLAELSEAKARINAEIESLRAKAGVLLGPEALLETIRGRNDLAVRARCRQEILKRVSRIDVRFGLDGVPTVAKVTFINGVIGGIRFKDKQTLIPFDAEGDFPMDEECDFSIAPDYHESEELSDCSFFMVVPYFD
jgi:Recombinase